MLTLKINRAIFRYIEHELYNYDETIKEIQEIRNNIIEQSPYKETVPGSGYISDPTARKAIKLITSTAIARMERTIRAIDRALELLPEEHNQLFQLKYRQKWTMKQICDEIPTSERTYFRWRREIVEMVAKEMGFVNVA